MRAVVQRVTTSDVKVDDDIVGRIGPGLLVLLGVSRSDEEKDAAYLADKVGHLRIFEDDEGKMNRSLLETRGEALVVSQFTLFADTKRGRRPSFTRAAPPEVAKPLLTQFVDYLQALGIEKVATGTFGAHMLVHIENNGPVTIILDTNEL